MEDPTNALQKIADRAADALTFQREQDLRDVLDEINTFARRALSQAGQHTGAQVTGWPGSPREQAKSGARVLDALKEINDYAHGAWFDEADATNEEREIMHRVRRAIAEAEGQAREASRAAEAEGRADG